MDNAFDQDEGQGEVSVAAAAQTKRHRGLPQDAATEEGVLEGHCPSAAGAREGDAERGNTSLCIHCAYYGVMVYYTTQHSLSYGVIHHFAYY